MGKSFNAIFLTRVCERKGTEPPPPFPTRSESKNLISVGVKEREKFLFIFCNVRSSRRRKKREEERGKGAHDVVFRSITILSPGIIVYSSFERTHRREKPIRIVKEKREQDKDRDSSRLLLLRSPNANFTGLANYRECERAREGKRREKKRVFQSCFRRRLH